MSVRWPKRFSGGADPGAEPGPLDAEIMAEKAASLGRSGGKVEAALAALAAGGEADRPRLVRAAADAVYSYLVQRELCGLRDHRWVIEDYRIPREVMARLGTA